MIKPNTYILHASKEEGSIWADVDINKTVIHEGEKTYEIPTYYLDLLLQKIYYNG